MAVNKNELIELYKTTRDELHHHDTVYIQVCTTMAIAFTFFIAAISLLLGQLALNSYVCHTKVAILVLALLLLAIFFWQIWRSDGRIQACKDVTERIEGKLKEGTSEFNELLVGVEVDHNRRDTRLSAKSKFWIYAALATVALGAFGYFLFCVIQVN